MPYTPHTAADVRQMLAAIGVAEVDDLFASLPDSVKLAGGLNLPPSRSEEEVRRIMLGFAGANRHIEEAACFLGGGIYDSIVPAIIDPLVSRSEFLTAYTPYQPEVSQGTLQAVFEWQSFICRLTGLAVANASMYDGATALCEAVRIGVAQTRRSRVVLPALLNPHYRRVVTTVLRGEGIAWVDAPAAADGTTDPDALAALCDDTVGAVVIQNPNYLGRIERLDALSAAARNDGALLVAVVNPVSLSLLQAPGEYGADLAVGEAQPFGLYPGGGGPLLGFLAAADKLKRRLPGRVVGRAVDRQGRSGYVLTLQAREQHIRREKATSNICTNSGLCALRATIYLALLGSGGLRELGEANRVRCAALQSGVEQVPGCSLPCGGPVFNEFVLRLPVPADLFVRHARQQGLLAGLPLAGFGPCREEDLLVAVTEKRTAEEISRYVEVLREFVDATTEERS